MVSVVANTVVLSNLIVDYEECTFTSIYFLTRRTQDEDRVEHQNVAQAWKYRFSKIPSCRSDEMWSIQV